LLFHGTIEKLLSRFLNSLLKSSFVCISESLDVSCWGGNANSTHRSRIKGGRSHFFRLRLRSFSKSFESWSGNFSNLRIQLLFRLQLIST